MNYSSGQSCKVCRDSGKPMAVYTSHNVKNGCPTLATTRCRKCQEFGHTTGYCNKTVGPKLMTVLTPVKTAKSSVIREKDSSDEEETSSTKTIVTNDVITAQNNAKQTPRCWADIMSDDDSD